MAAENRKKKPLKKLTIVREHPMHVPISKKNPTGVTLRDRHIRRLKGTYLDKDEIAKIFREYDRSKIVFPAKGKLEEYPNADKYDEQIAVWTDYFNKKFRAEPPLDPDVVKALLGSESRFLPDPPRSKKGQGISQITPDTLEILQDPEGEAKEFTFTKMNRKDLKDPDIAIPMAVRWLHRKRVTAQSKLGRAPNHQELILEYKGLLKSKTTYQNAAIKNYLGKYNDLKK
jgi:hypothetical protein